MLLNDRGQNYKSQRARWPAAGRHLLAHFDDHQVVVYMVQPADLAEYASTHGEFGESAAGDDGIVWWTPSVLAGAAICRQRKCCERVTLLAITMERISFEAILKKAASADFDPAVYPDEKAWRRAQVASAVRVSWRPDSEPDGRETSRYALHVGLLGKAAAHFSQGGWIRAITDASTLVDPIGALTGSAFDELMLPAQRHYLLDDTIARRIGLR
jgi:hypothetical protein